MIKEKLKSIRVKLFLTLSITLITIIMILILANNFVLEKFYLYSKQKSLMDAYQIINEAYQQETSTNNLELQLEKIAIYNNFDILIKSEDNINVYSSNRDFISNVMSNSMQIQVDNDKGNILYSKENVVIRKTYDLKNRINLYYDDFTFG